MPGARYVAEEGSGQAVRLAPRGLQPPRLCPPPRAPEASSAARFPSWMSGAGRSAAGALALTRPAMGSPQRLRSRNDASASASKPLGSWGVFVGGRESEEFAVGPGGPARPRVCHHNSRRRSSMWPRRAFAPARRAPAERLARLARDRLARRVALPLLREAALPGDVHLLVLRLALARARRGELLGAHNAPGLAVAVDRRRLAPAGAAPAGGAFAGWSGLAAPARAAARPAASGALPGAARGCCACESPQQPPGMPPTAPPLPPP
jgi:hypothetical protein